MFCNSLLQAPLIVIYRNWLILLIPASPETGSEVFAVGSCDPLRMPRLLVGSLGLLGRQAALGEALELWGVIPRRSELAFWLPGKASDFFIRRKTSCFAKASQISNVCVVVELYLYIYIYVGSKTSTYFLAVCNTCDIPIGSHWCARNYIFAINYAQFTSIYLMTYDIWTVLEAFKTKPHSLRPPRKVS